MTFLIKQISVQAVMYAALTITGFSHAEAPAYSPSGTLSGKLSSIGSDTLEVMMGKWSKAFTQHHGGVSFDITAKGSSTAPPALINGSSSLGPMSRQMKTKEVSAFKAKYGYKPTAIRVSVDALAVYVHKDNPVAGMTMEQVDQVFSKDQECSGEDPIDNWSAFGGADSGVKVYGRNASSGTHGYFKKKSLCKGAYKGSITELAHSADIVTAIAKDTSAVGYSGIGYKTDGVRAVPLAKEEGDDFVEASPENAASGTYPLGRFLYIYVKRAPGEAMGDLEREFLKFILSKEGQQVVADSGYIPLPEATLSKEIAKL